MADRELELECALAAARDGAERRRLLYGYLRGAEVRLERERGVHDRANEHGEQHPTREGADDERATVGHAALHEGTVIGACSISSVPDGGGGGIVRASRSSA